MKNRYKAIISYNGSNYHGWAKQPKQTTIQGTLESVFLKIFKQKVKVFASGRTDAGVNAWGQVIHFDLENLDIKPSVLINILNKSLPYDIRFKKINKTQGNFNARFMAKNKTYVYSINTGQVNALENSIVYQYNKYLNLKKMKEVAKLFLGKHNFLSFSTDQRTGDTLNKTIYKIRLKVKDDILYVIINGDGFLRSQVRMMVGIMLAYEQGKINLVQIKDLFDNPKKGKAIYKAPACGLCLFKVRY